MRLLGVMQLLPGALDSQMRKQADLTLTEYYALAMLSDAPDRRIQTKQLAVFTNTTLSRLSRVISGLEDAGLLRRVPNEHDGRATDIELTDAGFDKLVAAAPEHVKFVRETIFTPQGRGGVQELHRTMGSILNELDPDQEMPRDPLEMRACVGEVTPEEPNN